MSSDYRTKVMRRYAAAKQSRGQWDDVLSDAYRYALPQYDQQASNDIGDRRGEKRGAQIYDMTAAQALDERTSRTMDALFPAFQRWVDLQIPKHLFGEGGVPPEIEQMFEDALDKLHAALDLSNFQTEMTLAVRDAHVCLGTIEVGFGTAENPLHFEAVPVKQMAIEEADDGVIRTSFRTLELPYTELEIRYPNARLPDEIREKVTAETAGTITVVEANFWNPHERVVEWSVWLAQGEHKIVEAVLTSERTIPFRTDKVPGEAMGRGPVMKALPDIKTANKVVELVLKNATIAVTGIWQADDDGVLNPANVKLQPGTIIPKAVGSSGLTPLQAPGQFDISQLVLGELRDSIRKTIVGPDLPAIDAGQRTAYELALRNVNQQRIEVPQTMRLLNECFDRIVRRAFDILSHPSMAGSIFYIPPLPIDPAMRVDLVPVSPMVRVRDEVRAAQAMQAFTNMLQILPEAARALVKPSFFRDFLKQSGFTEAQLESQAAIDLMTEANAQSVGQLTPETGAAGSSAGVGPAAGSAMAQVPIPTMAGTQGADQIAGSLLHAVEHALDPTGRGSAGRQGPSDQTGAGQ